MDENLAIQTRNISKYLLYQGGCGTVYEIETVSQILYFISPALIMDALDGYSEISNILWGLFFFTIYLITNIWIGYYVFDRQDELNYGE